MNIKDQEAELSSKTNHVCKGRLAEEMPQIADYGNMKMHL